MNNKIHTISVSKLHPFRNQSYKILDNRKMYALLASIQENGMLSALLVRALENGECISQGAFTRTKLKEQLTTYGF